MTDYPDYPLATNRAYDVLRWLNIQNLPVDIEAQFSRFNNVNLYSYSDFCKRQGISEYEFLGMGVSNYGFTLRKARTSIVLYNQNLDDQIIRFTLAHELGHLYLLHDGENDKSDKEANCFARNFLCPIPVVNAWNLTDPNDYVNIFNVSPPMAEASVHLKQNDFFNITGANYLSTSNQFSLQSFTKKQQLIKYNAQYQRCANDFLGLATSGAVG